MNFKEEEPLRFDVTRSSPVEEVLEVIREKLAGLLESDAARHIDAVVSVRDDRLTISVQAKSPVGAWLLRRFCGEA